MANPKIQFYYNFSTLLNSGVPIFRAISLTGSSAPGRYRRLAREMEQDVRNGMMISDSMARFKRYFEPFDVEMVRTGEETGQLSEMLAELSRWHEFRQRNRRTMSSGMLLPIVIVHAAAIFIPVVDYPRFYMGGDELIGYLLGALKVLALFYIPASVILGIIFLTPKRGIPRRVLDSVVMVLPLIGSAVRNLSISRYCKTFSLTYSAGIPIVRAARMATNACRNSVMYHRVKGAAEAAEVGENMSTGFSKMLDREFRELWVVGEEAGDLDKTTERLGDLYADRAEFKFRLIAEWTPRIVYMLVSIYLVYKILSFYGGMYGGVLQGF